MSLGGYELLGLVTAGPVRIDVGDEIVTSYHRLSSSVDWIHMMMQTEVVQLANWRPHTKYELYNVGMTMTPLRTIYMRESNDSTNLYQIMNGKNWALQINSRGAANWVPLNETATNQQFEVSRQ